MENGVFELDPRIARLKERLLAAPYEICLARAFHFTRSYRETEGMDAHLRNAIALRRTLENQKIFIRPDEHIAGTKTEKFLAGPLSVERGDFLRTLQFEMDILPKKVRPFVISEEEKKLFWEEIFPYWNGRTVRDAKAREWERQGIIDTRPGTARRIRSAANAARFARSVGKDNLRKILGANFGPGISRRRLKHLKDLRYEYARNNPTPAVFCFDVQGHLSLGIDKVVNEGIESIIRRARERLKRLRAEEPDNVPGRNFLGAVIMSLEATIRYSERFADLATEMAGRSHDFREEQRLATIAEHCRHVPRFPPRTFAEAIQAAWITQAVGEIQYGTHEVFAPGRADQYLYPYYREDRENGLISREEAIAWIQEFLLKLSANVEPIPEAGMETNSVLGNSQHVVTIGGITPEGNNAVNELSYLILEAFEQLNGTVNQLAVRFHPDTPDQFTKRTARVFRRTSGISIHNDTATIAGLREDGMREEDARDYCIVGCIETSGQSDTHGCPGGHELVLPAALWLTLSRGSRPPALPGQKPGLDTGDPGAFESFAEFLSAFRRQVSHQVKILVDATAGKDRAYRDLLPAPYVSALMDDCLEKALDITAGGARYDFTSIDVRGLATLVDSLLAIRTFVYERRELGLGELIKICRQNFAGRETLRQRVIHEAPKYGVGGEQADALALEVIAWLSEEAGRYRNIRGGRFRVCYYSYGNHVIDGFFLDATPDGRRRGEPISNGVSPTNIIIPAGGPLGSMRTAAKFPPAQVSSGIALNIRFHPDFLRSEQGVESLASMVNTYFRMGGMQIQPNVVSTETLREAQHNPDRHRDLVVKVSGYSAYFCDLGRSIQEDIIARAEFGEFGR